MPAAKINRRASVLPGQRARGKGQGVKSIGQGAWLGSRITIRLCKYFCCTLLLLLLLLFVFVALLLSPFLSLPLAWHGKFLSPFARCAFPFLFAYFLFSLLLQLNCGKSRPGKSSSSTRAAAAAAAALLFFGVRKRQKDIIKRGCQRYRRQSWTKASAKCTAQWPGQDRAGQHSTAERSTANRAKRHCSRSRRYSESSLPN